jgi:hypothetical protein
MPRTIRRSVPYRPEPVYNYQKCAFCEGAVDPADLVTRPIGGTFYFGHRQCFNGRTDIEIARIQQIVMEVD